MTMKPCLSVMYGLIWIRRNVRGNVTYPLHQAEIPTITLHANNEDMISDFVEFKFISLGQCFL